MDNIYQDISKRTQGDIYIGVVGPVRTGKSTFIKKFMDLVVLPNIENAYKKERTLDELPQSGAGKTIMTTEPKFIPNEAVNVKLSNDANLNVRMIDCVGYVVDGAIGHTEDDMPRMVKTPWYDEEIPFIEAAEIGTKKVIKEHSTIGLVITSDGSITDIEREEYIKAETRVINELKEINKPFIVLLNSTNPTGQMAKKVKEDIEKTHNVTVYPVNCDKLSLENVNDILENVLCEFPITEISINIPSWIDTLESTHYLKEGIYSKVVESVKNVNKICECTLLKESIAEYEYIKEIKTNSINLGTGKIILDVLCDEDLFYKILGETTNLEINGKDTLLELVTNLTQIKKEYEKIESALREVNEIGYGIVTPTLEELKLEEPEIVKQGNRFGIRLKASAPSIHMIKAEVETEVSPIVGTEKQSEELVNYLLKEFDESPEKIWESNIFGKSVHELVNEGLRNKLYKMPSDAQQKLQETLERIINEGSGGLICIIL
ncbi:MAG: stage IV sporulation protein A [Ruminococcaceae bacterium]|nr:stage IV sporulation protein A [Oscillospiraceae bacterium]